MTALTVAALRRQLADYGDDDLVMVADPDTGSRTINEPLAFYSVDRVYGPARFATSSAGAPGIVLAINPGAVGVRTASMARAATG